MEHPIRSMKHSCSIITDVGLIWFFTNFETITNNIIALKTVLQKNYTNYLVYKYIFNFRELKAFQTMIHKKLEF